MSNPWRQIAIRSFCDRMIGFSIPQNNVVLVISYEGMHLIDLKEPVTIVTDEEHAEYDCFNPDDGIAIYQGRRWQIMGLYPGSPILKSPSGEELRFDEEELKISIWQAGNQIWTSTFENFSGDWAAATFSEDGNLIILGCPYDFDFRVWSRF